MKQGRSIRQWRCPMQEVGPSLWEKRFVLPPGWMKTYPHIGMRPIAREIRFWRQRLQSSRPLVLAVSYPHYLFLRDLINPDFLVYYNMDDYAYYWSSRSETIRRLEQKAVEEATLSVFCARFRAEELTNSVGSAADRIVHLPHGAPSAFMASRPLTTPGPAPSDLARLPGPRLGFVGSMEDRLDWDLIACLAREIPDCSIVLIGKEPAPADHESWYRSYQRAISNKNVYILGWKNQNEIGRYISSFDICIIPYLIDHPFNLAACPTKVMDYMASSRPMISTALPECRLYSDLFDVVDSTSAFVESVRRILRNGSDDGRAHLRWARARANTWERTAAQFLRLFQERSELHGS